MWHNLKKKTNKVTNKVHQSYIKVSIYIYRIVPLDIMEVESDDSSAASSGDEMLDMVVPFSQRSTSPKKDSDNEDGNKDSNKKKQAAVKETSGKKRKHKEEEEDIAADGEIDEAEIEQKGMSINICSLLLHVCISCEHMHVHLF